MKEFEFKPKDWVLVRDTDVDAWSLNIFSHKVADNEEYPYFCISGEYLWKMCIPYEGNEHLLGTTDPYEPPYEPKDGDFICCEKPMNNKNIKCIKIYRTECWDYARLRIHEEELKLSVLETHEVGGFRIIRLATEEEKQMLLDALHEVGKDWDAEKEEVVDYKWKPKKHEVYHTPIINNDHLFIPFSFDYSDEEDDKRRVEKGWAFKTREKCQDFCNRLNEAIKNVK